jgi:hypothetical protein
MDATRRVNLLNERGVALVYLAIALVVLMGMAAVAIDLGYMYASKAQLQTAADAGALAGADRLLDIGTVTPNISEQSDVKSVAQNIAQQNTAADANVVLKNNGTNIIGPNNDLALGHWDGTKFTQNTVPMNALKVKTRRTADNAGVGPGVGPIPAFFSKVLGKQNFDVSSEAIAANQVKASNYISICQQTLSCGSCQSEAGCAVDIKLSPDPNDVGNVFAWTTYYDNSTSTSDIRALIRGAVPAVNACNTNIYTSMGQDVDALRDLESAMYSRAYQPDAKYPINSTSDVTAWDIIVPVTEICNPTTQGNANDPHLVTWYAKVHVESICVQGAAGFFGVKPNNSECPNGPAGAPFEKKIYITNVKCISCSNPDLNQFLGLHHGLVK